MCSIVISNCYNIPVADPCEEAPAIAVVAANVSQVKKRMREAIRGNASGIEE